MEEELEGHICVFEHRLFMRWLKRFGIDVERFRTSVDAPRKRPVPRNNGLVGYTDLSHGNRALGGMCPGGNAAGSRGGRVAGWSGATGRPLHIGLTPRGNGCSVTITLQHASEKGPKGAI